MEPNHEAASASGSRTTLLAEAVRGRRRELGLRQTEVADLAGCSARFVHTLEHGKASLRLDKILDVLEVLGMDLAVVAGCGRIVAAADEAGAP
ncbi:MAG: helix-turn-helix domain-containing protein [Gemmatimonadota bacterium]